MLNNFCFCGTYYDADCVVNKVDGKIIGEGWFEENMEENGRGLGWVKVMAGTWRD